MANAGMGSGEDRGEGRGEGRGECAGEGGGSGEVHMLACKLAGCTDSSFACCLQRCKLSGCPSSSPTLRIEPAHLGYSSNPTAAA